MNIKLCKSLFVSVFSLVVTLSAFAQTSGNNSGMLKPGQKPGGKPHAPAREYITYYYDNGTMWFDLPDDVQTVTVSIEAPNQSPQLFYNVDEFSRLSVSTTPATYTITCITVLGKEYTGTWVLQ